MRVFVCEYVTGGGMCGGPLAPSLRREGDLMLTALVNDLAEIPGVAVLAARDPRLAAPDVPASFAVVEGPGEVWPTWRRLIRSADALWPIAPETGGALERLSGLAAERQRVLLGCAPEAVRLTASKRLTSAHLAACGVPVVPTGPLDRPPRGEHGIVVKPDDGAGCTDTWLFRDERDLRAWACADPAAARFVAQPYLPGQATSLSVLCRDGEAWLLSCNRQKVAVDQGRFRYLGGVVGGPSDRWTVYERIAADVARAVPGLWGYVGIDLVETLQGPVVLEINPRLTTSYVGLRRSLGLNPAALVLDLLRGEAPSRARLSTSAPVELDLGEVHA